MHVMVNLTAHDVIDWVLISALQSFCFALFSEKIFGEVGVVFGDSNELGVPESIEHRVLGKSYVDRVFALYQHVMGVDDTAGHERLELELCAGVHHQIQLHCAVEDDDQLILDLLVLLFVHVVEHAAFLFDFANAQVRKLTKDLVFQI